MSRRKPLSTRATSGADPNRMDPGAEHASGRRSGSPAQLGVPRRTLPPYAPAAGERSGIVTDMPYGDRKLVTFDRTISHQRGAQAVPAPQLRIGSGRRQLCTGLGELWFQLWFQRDLVDGRLIQEVL